MARVCRPRPALRSAAGRSKPSAVLLLEGQRWGWPWLLGPVAGPQVQQLALRHDGRRLASAVPDPCPGRACVVLAPCQGQAWTVQGPCQGQACLAQVPCQGLTYLACQAMEPKACLEPGPCRGQASVVQAPCQDQVVLVQGLVAHWACRCQAWVHLVPWGSHQGQVWVASRHRDMKVGAACPQAAMVA
mmetsp:Transcript_44420/g.128555  ORF Transcript_44420/g.128555 Transcript_44420/m.128555 type:complete len:188 (-) Transcript_44420:2620-3183(-)